MANRIRYAKTSDENIVVSKRHLVSKVGIRYQVTLNLKEYTYEIKNMGTYHTMNGGNKINNLNVLKRKVKEHLLNLGVEFKVESRNRTFGLCPEGYTQQLHLEKTKE